MALSETCIVERDPATYQVVTIKPLCEVFALVRYSDDPQRFTIEYSSGHVKRYSATDRYILSGLALYQYYTRLMSCATISLSNLILEILAI